MFSALLACVTMACAEHSAFDPSAPAEMARKRRPTLLSLSVQPESTTVAAEGTAQFTASGVWSDGSTGAPDVAWSATGGSITSTGLYTAPASAGTYRVIAKQRGGSPADTSVAVVAAPPPPPPPPPPPGTAVECGTVRPEWVWCDDFEQDRLALYFEGPLPSFARTSGVGHDASWGMRVRFEAGMVNAGSLKLAFGRTPQSYFRPVDAGSANYRELYWRMYLKHASGWIGGGGDKLSRMMIFASSTSWAQAMIAHVWSGGTNGNYLAIDPASGTDTQGNLQSTTYNDFPNLRWLGAAGSVTPIFDASHVGAWYCIETRVRLNDAGLSNGVFEMWINGVLEAQRTGLNWVGNYSAYGLNALFIENYWNAGSPVAQERYMDRLVVSTQRIGC